MPFSIIDEEFQTSPMHSNPSVTRIPAMALPLQEGPETCSRNVSYKETTYKLECSMIMQSYEIYKLIDFICVKFFVKIASFCFVF